MTLDSLINRSDEILDLFKCLDDRDNSFDIETLLNDKQIRDHIYFVDNKGRDYDPDSSELAWQYFRNIYKGKLDIDTHLAGKVFGTQTIRISGVFKYHLLDNQINIRQRQWGYLEENTISMAGDCVFNFNDDKCKRFIDIIESDDTIAEEKASMLKNKLWLCAAMHHTPYNFALLPIAGAIGNAKNSTCNDRGDVFFYYLKLLLELIQTVGADNVYKKVERKKRDNDKFQEGYSLLKDFAGRGTTQQKLILKKRLIDYLKIFDNFEQYIAIFYNIDASMKYNESTLLEALVQSGAKEQFKDADDLENYMDLAIAYWKYQQSVYKRKVG